MGEMFSSYKELGLIGFLFVVMAFVIVALVRIISNHINHSTDVMRQVRGSLDTLNQTIRDMRLSIDRLLDKL